MKLVSYDLEGHPQLAFLVHERIYDMDAMHPGLPATMTMFLNFWDDFYPVALAVNASLHTDPGNKKSRHVNDVRLLAPVPHPASCRDAYAFRQHVATSRKSRGLGMIPEFDSFPVFYFTNHHSIIGPGEVICMPDHFNKLDFELEAAIVICREGKNIPASAADSYIGGFMIMNDLSCRSMQMDEMKLNLGPAKGKDFATATGPFFVTVDELQQYLVGAKEGHTGNAYDLKMKCTINGIAVSAGSMAEMEWTFAEIIERCSYGAQLFPGDIIGSGTVGTGCFLELNGTGRLNDPAYAEQWLRPGDVMEMEIDALGTLKNTIVAEDSDYRLPRKERL